MLKQILIVSLLGLILGLSSLALVYTFELIPFDQTDAVSDNVTPSENLENYSQSFAFETIYSSSSRLLQSGNKVEQVFSTQDEWENFWQWLYYNYDPLPLIPIDNITGELLIATSMGNQPNGGYSVSITEIKFIDNDLVVYVNEISPGGTCTVTNAFTHPLEIVKISQIAYNNVIFERTPIIHQCN